MKSSTGCGHIFPSFVALATILVAINAAAHHVPPQLPAPASTSDITTSQPELFSQVSQNMADLDGKVKITLFYETLCPYSVRFIRGQLYPVYLKLEEYIKVVLVPYGNAKTIKNPDGSVAFKCQHGPQECVGNTVHACAIAHIPTEDKLMAYIKCTLEKKKGFSKKGKTKVENSAKQCAKMLSIDFPPIQACYQGSEGVHLELMYGNQTNQLVPPLKGVPWILFNDVYDDVKEDTALTDLLAVACAFISGEKPSACPTILLNS